MEANHARLVCHRRTESYWVKHIAPILPHHDEQSNARDWLSALLPGIPRWRPNTPEATALVRKARRVPIPESQDWARRISNNPQHCETPEFSAFLNRHRVYAEATGDSGFLNKTFNSLATSLVRADTGRVALAVSLVEEALKWQPRDSQTWTIYATMLSTARRQADAIAVLWKARHQFPWDSFIRNELGRILRQAGDLIAAEGVLREAASHFPGDEVCRNGLAETLRAMGRFDDARRMYEQTRQDFPRDVFCRTGLADLLIDLNELAHAEQILGEALELDATNRPSRGVMARVLLIRGARSRDEGLRGEAESILRQLAYEGDQVARKLLQDIAEQWQQALNEPNTMFRRDLGIQQGQADEAQNDRAVSEMTVAERLGRAMITLWQTERAEDATLRLSLCAHATALLDVPEDKIDDDLLAAFVETRGLVLLASGDAQRAAAYFEAQIRHYGRGGWIGIQLGDQRARIALGLPKDADDTVEAPSSQSARFALYVARVIQTLSASPQESEVRDLLKTLYPRAADFAARAQPDAEGGLSIESGAEMLGAFLQTRWFRPAGIQTAEDLDSPDALHAVVERINNTRTDTFDVISNSTLALAA